SPGKHAVGMLFEYPADARLERRVEVPSSTQRAAGLAGRVGVGLIGAGNFATGTLIPALKAIPYARLLAICSSGGLSARSAAERHGFESCASDYQEVLANDQIQAVVIATRHDTHARLAADA